MMQISGISSQLQLNVLTPGTNLPKGAKLEAQVVAVDPKTNVVTLEQADGSQIKAQNLSDNPLEVGDTVSLTITGQKGNAAVATITALNNQPIQNDQVTDVQLQLLSVGLSATPEHIRLATLLFENGHPVTKEAMAALARIFDKLPDIPPHDAVFMAVNEIPPTPENAQALSTIGSLHQEINQIIDEINQALSALPGEPITQETPADQAATPVSISQENAPQGDKPILPSAAPQNAEGTAAVTQQAAAVVPSSPQAAEQAIDQAAVQPPLAQQTDVSPAPSAPADAPAPSEAATGTPSAAPLAPQDVISYVQEKLGASHPIVTKVLEQVVPQTLSAPGKAITLSPELQAALNALPQQLADQVLELLPQMHSLIQKHLGQHLLAQFQKEAFVKVDENLSGMLIKDQLTQMPGKLVELSNIKMTDMMQQVGNTLRLSDQTMAYVQIPVTILNREQTAELYVLKRNHGQKGDADSTKVVFALNTEHLGRIESILTTMKKDLTLHIRLQDKEIKSLIDGNLDVLRAGLEHTAYHLVSLTTGTIDKPINVTNAHQFFGYKQLDISI